MRASLATLRFIFIAIDVTAPAPLPSDGTDGNDLRFLAAHDANAQRRTRVGGPCSDDDAWDGGFGGCLSYAPGEDNAGYCRDDGGCSHCACACAQECIETSVGGAAGSGVSVGAGSDGVGNSDSDCLDDPSFEAGFGPCSAYAEGGENEGYCQDDDACLSCSCACAYACDAATTAIGGIDTTTTASGGTDGDGGSGRGDCNDEDSFDGGYGGCSAYAPGGENEGYCNDDGGCSSCTCSCALECSAATAAATDGGSADGGGDSGGGYDGSSSSSGDGGGGGEVDPNCVNDNWQDSEGDACDVYTQFPFVCGFEESGAHCCACGGGGVGGAGKISQKSVYHFTQEIEQRADC